MASISGASQVYNKRDNSGAAAIVHAYNPATAIEAETKRKAALAIAAAKAKKPTLDKDVTSMFDDVTEAKRWDLDSLEIEEETKSLYDKWIPILKATNGDLTIEQRMLFKKEKTDLLTKAQLSEQQKKDHDEFVRTGQNLVKMGYVDQEQLDKKIALYRNPKQALENPNIQWDEGEKDAYKKAYDDLEKRDGYVSPVKYRAEVGSAVYNLSPKVNIEQLTNEAVKVVEPTIQRLAYPAGEYLGATETTKIIKDQITPVLASKFDGDKNLRRKIMMEYGIPINIPDGLGGMVKNQKGEDEAKQSYIKAYTDRYLQNNAKKFLTNKPPDRGFGIGGDTPGVSGGKQSYSFQSQGPLGQQYEKELYTEAFNNVDKNGKGTPIDFSMIMSSAAIRPGGRTSGSPTPGVGFDGDLIAIDGKEVEWKNNKWMYKGTDEAVSSDELLNTTKTGSRDVRFTNVVLLPVDKNGGIAKDDKDAIAWRLLSNIKDRTTGSALRMPFKYMPVDIANYNPTLKVIIKNGWYKDKFTKAEAAEFESTPPEEKIKKKPSWVTNPTTTKPTTTPKQATKKANL